MMATTEYPALPRERPPSHPGEVLREIIIPALGIPIAQAARDLGLSRQTLYTILRGKASITPDTALRLGKFVGGGPEVWLRMQQAYDLWHAERRLAEELARIPTREAPEQPAVP